LGEEGKNTSWFSGHRRGVFHNKSLKTLSTPREKKVVVEFSAGRRGREYWWGGCRLVGLRLNLVKEGPSPNLKWLGRVNHRVPV